MAKKGLFSINDLKSPSERAALSSSIKSEEPSKEMFFRGRSSDFMKELDHLFTIESKHINFMTAGTLSLHTIIEFVIAKYGKCLEMYISTWAIKEAAARSLYNLKHAGKIGSLYGIFDYRIKTVDSQNFYILEQIFTKYELTKNHSKVILMEYRNRYITILCSANLSNNPRIEAGFISQSKETLLFHKGWMMNVFDGKKVY